MLELITKILKLTKPVVDWTKVSPLIEDNVENDHDTDHRVERGQNSHWRKISPVVDNHEGEEDQHSWDQIHQHLQHQDDDVKGEQSWFVQFTEKKVVSLIELLRKYENLILMIETEIVMREKIMERILQDTRSSMYLR